MDMRPRKWLKTTVLGTHIQLTHSKNKLQIPKKDSKTWVFEIWTHPRLNFIPGRLAFFQCDSGRKIQVVHQNMDSLLRAYGILTKNAKGSQW